MNLNLVSSSLYIYPLEVGSMRLWQVWIEIFIRNLNHLCMVQCTRLQTVFHHVWSDNFLKCYIYGIYLLPCDVNMCDGGYFMLDGEVRLDVGYLVSCISNVLSLGMLNVSLATFGFFHSHQCVKQTSRMTCPPVSESACNGHRRSYVTVDFFWVLSSSFWKGQRFDQPEPQPPSRTPLWHPSGRCTWKGGHLENLSETSCNHKLRVASP